MRTRLVPYVPFGAKLAPLPDALESQLVTPLGELPTANVHYHRQGVNAVVLDGITELGFEYWDGAGWVEPPNCRFLSMKGSFDHLEETPTRKYDFVGIGWMLRKAKVWEASGLPLDADGKVQFLSANAGTIMATLIQNAQGRGWGSGISVDFSSTKDSAGQAWGKVITIAYDLDLDLEAVLANLYQQGICDYRFEGRTLRIFNPDTAMGRDLTTGADPLRLVVADGQTSAPEDWTNEDLLTDAMVLGEEGKRWEFTNGANTALGRLETVITQSGVSDPGTASLLSQIALLQGSETRISYTREFVITDESRVVPFRDYVPGDWVSGQRGTGFERLRTHSLSLTIDAEGVKGHAVLGDRLEDLLTKLAKRTKGITGGASAGGSGGRPAPEGPDTRTPAAPSGLVVGASPYLDTAGNVQGQIEADWAHNGQATNGTAMDVDRFQVFYRLNVLGEAWKSLRSTQDTELAYSPLPVYTEAGEIAEYGFKVRAVGGNGRASAFTPVTVVTMNPDTTAPPAPEFRAQDLTTWLRTVYVNATGKGASGEDMPSDLSHFNVYQASSPTAAGVLIGSKEIAGPGLVHQTGTMPTETVWFYLTAVDRTGNESVNSSRHSATPTANVDVSEIAKKLTAANLVLDDVREGVLTTGSVTLDKLGAAGALDEVVAQNIYGGIANLVTVNASQVNVADFTNFAPTLAEVPNHDLWLRENGMLLLVDETRTQGYRFDNPVNSGHGQAIGPFRPVIPGEELFGEAYIMRGSGNVAVASVRYFFYGKNKNYLSAPIVASSTVGWSVLSGHITVPDGAAYARIAVRAEQSTASWCAFADIRGYRMSGGELIVNGSITAAKVTASEEMWTKVLGAHRIKVDELDSNSITSDAGFIGDLQAAIVTANVFQGKEFNGGTFTGGTFQTLEWPDSEHPGQTNQVVWDTSGIKLLSRSPGGTSYSFSLNAETGSIFMGEAELTVATIYGGTINGATFYSSWDGGLDYSTVVMNPTGLYGYDDNGNRMFTMATGNGFVFADSRFGVGAVGGKRIITSSANDGSRRGIWWSDTGDGSIGGSNTGGVYIEDSGAQDLNLRGGYGQGVTAWGGLTVYSGLVSDARLTVKQTPSTTLNANAHIDINGVVYKSSSASRYKLDQQVMDLPDELLDITVKDWVDKAQHEDREQLAGLGVRNQDDQVKFDYLAELKRVPGVIAEDVAAVPGGEPFVIREPDGRTQGVDKPSLALAQIAVLKRQLDAAIERFEALEGESIG